MALYKIDNLQKPINFACGDDTEMRIVQNAKNLLMTRMGEVPYDRYRGFDHSLFGLSAPQFDAALMPEIDRVMMWEPRVQAVSAKCYVQKDGQTVIEVMIDVNSGEQ